MTCAEHYACDCFQAEAQCHRDRIEALTAQVEANRARYTDARRERDEYRELAQTRAEVGRRALEERDAARLHAEGLSSLLSQAWDKIPCGYTVLRGQIMTALGRQGCTQCGYPCGEEGEGPACIPYP